MKKKPTSRTPMSAVERARLLVERQRKHYSERAVEHPRHYNMHPSGIECIEIVEHFNFLRGSAIKYIWRAGEKGSELEDLKKARCCLDREIARLEKGNSIARVQP